MTIKDVADHLKVSVSTVQNIRRENRHFPKAIKVSGRRKLFSRNEINEWAKAQR